jgi:hypothetical protein
MTDRWARLWEALDEGIRLQVTDDPNVVGFHYEDGSTNTVEWRQGEWTMMDNKKRKGTKMSKKDKGPMTIRARPRDVDERKRKPGERTLVTYRRAVKEWAIDAYDAKGKWLFTHYNPKPMNEMSAKRLAKNWFPKDARQIPDADGGL